MKRFFLGHAVLGFAVLNIQFEGTVLGRFVLEKRCFGNTLSGKVQTRFVGNEMFRKRDLLEMRCFGPFGKAFVWTRGLLVDNPWTDFSDSVGRSRSV